ncbi:glycerate kinase [Arthrobacter sp. JSM 101049]|uniref:glycerate kinase n=1 Tax=Arthrobacter sp. JSM 101049 TaxID=929097 RepID=UPI0035658DD9
MTSTPSPVIVVAPDSFKGSASAAQAAAAMARGVRAVAGADARILELPMADGGEGTLDALLATWGTEPLTIETTDALRRPCTARYGMSQDGTTGIIEAAEANGLPQVSDVPLQPLVADTHGVGLIAKRLLDAGVDEILLCIGGSATTDGGAGLLTALGARFLDASGTPVAPGGGALSSVATVDQAGLHPRATAVTWRIAVDVDNPLCGPRGAAAVFGPQKGASPDDVTALDAGLRHLAQVLGADSLAGQPGCGAAGGMPLALVALLGAQMVPGAELVAAAIGLRGALEGAAVVLTGEGRLDTQSLGGKVVDAVRRTADPGARVVVIAGAVQLDAAACRDAGLTAAFSIAPGPAGLAELQADAERLIEDTAAQACAALGLGHAPGAAGR